MGTKLRVAQEYGECLAHGMQIFALSLSINAWVFGSITGLNHYKIDPLIGTEYSIKCIFVSSLLVQVALTVVKIAILLFYKRVFPMPKFKIAIWVAIFFVSCWGIILFFLVLLQGKPVSASWTGKGVLQFSPNALGLSQVGTSIALDVIVLCFPLPVIFRLHMPTSRKVGLAMVFWLGIFCCVAAIVRMVLLKRVLQGVVNANDQIYTESTQFIFMIIEPNASIIAGCLPCYGPLFSGGRAPESLVRSIRSTFSLESTRGSLSGNTRDNSTGGKYHGNSDIELQDVASSSQNSDVSTSGDQGLQIRDDGVINVTKAVEIVRT
ncbi:hypothetical protein F5Y13DRAFT_201420 [Hypoxylon sp. FL1857]|nr:hypothetical protein F5Y13DRAFT_201420 [Hypoxylon sp. FL1857]